MGNRSYNSPLNKAPLRTVTGRGNDPTYDDFLVTRKAIQFTSYSRVPEWPLHDKGTLLLLFGLVLGFRV